MAEELDTREYGKWARVGFTAILISGGVFLLLFIIIAVIFLICEPTGGSVLLRAIMLFSPLIGFGICVWGVLKIVELYL